MLVLIMYNVFSVPVNICFDMDLSVDHPWFWVEALFDAIFLVDIAVNFSTGVETDSFGVTYDRRFIAKNYLTGWFWIDFPSSVRIRHVPLR